MKKQLIGIILTLIIPTMSYAQQQKTGTTYDAVVTRIVDGDTVAIQAKWVPDPMKKEIAIRIYGVDTPEKGYKAKCAAEKELGLTASKYTKDVISQAKTKQVVFYEWDKYGGRILGDMVLDGQSLRTLLIQNGYAREYYGTARTSWCK